MQMIASHIERAILVLESLGSVMAGAGFGLILVTADRCIVYVNDTAETLMRASNGLRCERNCISAVDFTSSRKLQSLITAASQQTDESVKRGSLIIRDEDGAASLVMHIVPLCPNSADVPPSKEHPVAGLVIVDSQSGITDRVNVFADLFALTPAEARVVSQLVLGRGLTKAASCLNIAPSTVRSHLTHIMEKTGTHRQAELVKVFYEVTLPWYGRRRAEDKSCAAIASDLAARRCGQGFQP